jgi:NitT/TauT family transport system substrate-binding protein
VSTQRRGIRELQHELSRREFLRVAAGAGAVGGGVVLLGGCGADDGNGSATSTPGIVIDPPPETTTIRLPKNAAVLSVAPIHLAGLFLPEEGFTDVQYIDVPTGSGGLLTLAAGEIDMGLPFAASVTAAADADDQLVILAGADNTSFKLFGNDQVQSLRDLKGKRIWVQKRDANDYTYAFIASLLAHVGIDVDNEVVFVELSPADAITGLQSGVFDAWVATSPTSPVGHVILNGTVDPPWSQYFGSMATGNRGFVEKHPAATKRALRAILKATDLCAREPERAARYIVDEGFTIFDYDEVLTRLTGLGYAAWRDFNPEDTVRFYALRLAEAGLVTSTPDELIARATDWRYLDEIKRELGVA